MDRLKRSLIILLAFALIFVFAGCGSSDTDTASEEAAETEQTEEAQENTSGAEPSDGNALVIYFSRTGEQYGVGVIDEGNTAVVAKMIAESIGADTFEIVPADDHYPMTYDELTDVAKQEQNENARPEYAGGVPDLSQYDTIFIGAPVWWGDWPMICYTFFEENADALSGKTLYPFCTHAGSGLSGFDSKLGAAIPGATIGEGFAVAGTDAQNERDNVKTDVEDWLSGIGY